MRDWLTPSEWVVLVLSPVFGGLANLWMNRGKEKRGDFDSIRDEWENIREAWSTRLRLSEQGERDCESRCVELTRRVEAMEEELAECHRQLFQQNQEMQVLKMESDIHKRRRHRE